MRAMASAAAASQHTSAPRFVGSHRRADEEEGAGDSASKLLTVASVRELIWLSESIGLSQSVGPSVDLFLRGPNCPSVDPSVRLSVCPGSRTA